MAKATVTASMPSIKIETFHLYLIGTAPLIVHAFPEKARKEMLQKQQKIAKGAREARDPFAEIEAARYILPNGSDGFPAIAFKAAAVTACTQLSDITKVAARQAFRIRGVSVDGDDSSTMMSAPGILEGSFVRTSLVPIISRPHTIREDVVRLSGPGRTAEVRYRPEYFPWGVVLEITLNSNLISLGQLGSMFQAAGHGVGVGEYRPERDGDAGTFDLVNETEFLAWRKANKL